MYIYVIDVRETWQHLKCCVLFWTPSDKIDYLPWRSLLRYRLPLTPTSNSHLKIYQATDIPGSNPIAQTLATTGHFIPENPLLSALDLPRKLRNSLQCSFLLRSIKLRVCKVLGLTLSNRNIRLDRFSKAKCVRIPQIQGPREGREDEAERKDLAVGQVLELGQRVQQEPGKRRSRKRRRD